MHEPKKSSQKTGLFRHFFIQFQAHLSMQFALSYLLWVHFAHTEPQINKPRTIESPAEPLARVRSVKSVAPRGRLHLR